MTDASNLPAVPGALLGTAKHDDAEIVFVPQRGMGLTVGMDQTSEPPAADTAAPSVPLMATLAKPAPVDDRQAEGLPPGPFQAPEFKRPGEIPKSEVADRFAKWREQLNPKG